MKKLTMTRVLTPLAALAFTLGVQASDYAKDDFEGQWSNSTGGYSFTAGRDQAADATAQYTYDGDAPAAALSPIGGSSNTKGLKLSTEDGILFRNLTDAQIGASGLYVDTDVQFTITDKSDRPEPVTTGGDTDKFIIWLEADEDAGTTNLCVWAREYKVQDNAIVNNSNKVYKLNSDAVTNIVPGTWHRLTVKAIARSNTEQLEIPGFQVYLDNNTTPLTSDSYFLPETDLSTGSGLLADSTLLDNRNFFPAMADGLGSLAKVGFSGEGKIDDFVVTDDIPSALPRVALTVNWDDSVVSSVTFLANGGNKTLTASGSLLTLEPGTTVSFSKDNIVPAAGVSLEQYSLSGNTDDWVMTGVADVSVAAGVATVGGETGSGAFTIALDRNTSSAVTIDWVSSGIAAGSIASVSYTIDGTTETVLGTEGYTMFEAELDDEITIAVTLAQDVVGVPVITATTGATGSGSTFTLTGNTAEFSIALATPVATVDGTSYATFAAAFAAAKTAGEPVILSDNIALTEAQAVAANEAVTIDLNGNTITGAEGATVFSNAGTLTITDSSQDHDGVVTTNGTGVVVANTGTLNLAYGTYKGPFTNSGTFDITTDCVFDNDLAGAYTPGAAYAMAETFSGSGLYQLASREAQIEGGAKYATLQAAVDAASPGDTVTVLKDCTISTSLSIAKNLTVHNDHTITGACDYAICIGATVSFEGSGKIERASGISGSPFCVGANETTRGTITAGTAGTLNFTGLTVCGGSGGNLIKLENGTVNMNGGVLTGGKRGIKADADAGSYTSTIVINGGTITNCTDCAVMASAESETGTATVTINGGTICGVLDDNAGKSAQKGIHTITIPGTSTARFDRDQSSFCASGYETTQSGGWYVVTAKQSSADWAADSSQIPANTSASAQYPELASSALATADAKELTDWAKAKSIAFSDVAADTSGTYVEAFLLNCAVADVATEKAAFKLNITVAADGTVTITTPDGKDYNGTLQLKGKAALTDAEWTNVPAPSSSYKFYKYELSL